MAAPSLSPDGNLGHFRLVERLGSGGMGIVYRAYDTVLKRDVAIKVLNARSLENPAARQRFRGEALILSRLNHPNVECVYEFRTEQDVDFLVLEFVSGTTLDELVRLGALAEAEVVSLGIQLARGLAAAHNQRVLHRDLKPGNLRVTPENVLKILDFGLAQLMTSPEDSTVTESLRHGPLAGTPAYLSPEQAAGKEPDVRSDIYSAGVVLYELATGLRAFPQAGQILLEAIQHGSPPPPRLKNKNVSPQLQAIILRCLEKDPAKRYQSARELQIELERISTEHHPSGPSLVAPLYAGSNATKRGRFVIAAIAAVVLAIAGLWLWRWLNKPPQQRVMAVLPMDSEGQDAATTALGLGLTETVTAKLVEASDTSAVQVVSPLDLRQYKVKTPEDARRQFGTDLVLESSLQRSGNTVRINCYLVDSKTHRQIAAKTVQAEVTDAFGLQDKVVAAALEMVTYKMRPGEFHKYKAVQDTNPAAYDAYIRGRGYLQDYEKPENIENAIAEFQQAVKIDPSYAPGYAGLGDAYWMQYKWLFKDKDVVARASQNCEMSLSLNAQLVEGHVCMGTILNNTGKYDKAIDEYKKALELNPQSDVALRGLAEAYENSGQLVLAEAAYKRAVELRPKYWGDYHALGLFYYKQERYAEAAAIFARETQLARENSLSYACLGGSLTALGKYDDAQSALQRSIDLRPNLQAYNNLAYLHYLLHRFPDSIAAEEHAMQINDGHWELWGNLADELYWTPERRTESRAKYLHAIELLKAQAQVNPNNARVQVYLAGYLAMLGNKQEALEHLQRALQQSPSEDILFRAAIAYNQLGETSKALDYLEKAAHLGYSRPIIRDSPEFANLQHNARYKALIASSA